MLKVHSITNTKTNIDQKVNEWLKENQGRVIKNIQYLPENHKDLYRVIITYQA